MTGADEHWLDIQMIMSKRSKATLASLAPGGEEEAG